MALVLLHLCLFDGVTGETWLYFRRGALRELSTEAELYSSNLKNMLREAILSDGMPAYAPCAALQKRSRLDCPTAVH
jgi:hypothetical protein